MESKKLSELTASEAATLIRQQVTTGVFVGVFGVYAIAAFVFVLVWISLQ